MKLWADSFCVKVDAWFLFNDASVSINDHTISQPRKPPRAASCVMRVAWSPWWLYFFVAAEDIETSFLQKATWKVTCSANSTKMCRIEAA